MFDIPIDEAGLPLEEAECRDYEEPMKKAQSHKSSSTKTLSDRALKLHVEGKRKDGYITGDTITIGPAIYKYVIEYGLDCSSMKLRFSLQRAHKFKDFPLYIIKSLAGWTAFNHTASTPHAAVREIIEYKLKHGKKQVKAALKSLERWSQIELELTDILDRINDKR